MQGGPRNGVVSYSQSGEDLQLAYLLGGVKAASYIDVGCLWPERLSNTYLFYERGGEGLCIDPNPDVAQEFAELRPRDAFLRAGVGDEADTLTYYVFGNPVFNTFAPAVAKQRQADAEQATGARREGRSLLREEAVPVMTLDSAIRAGMPALLDRDWIDFLSIDVEGLETAVLGGFSFAPRPRVIVVEHFWRRQPHAGQTPAGCALARHIQGHGYRLAGYMGHNLYFASTSNP